MLNKRAVQYFIFIALLLVLGLWFLQNTYYSTINAKLAARENLKKNIENEYQKLELNKNDEEEKIDTFNNELIPLTEKKLMKPIKTAVFTPESIPTKDDISKVNIITKMDVVTTTVNPLFGLNSVLLNEKKLMNSIITKSVFTRDNIANRDDLSKTDLIAKTDTVTSTVNPFFGLNSVLEAENLYFKTITLDTIKCSTSKRFGRADDGGWDVCIMGNLKINNGKCTVYSFGVNYIWEFDDELSSNYQCIVRTFDPSMTNEPNEYQRSSKVWFYKLGLGKETAIWSNGWKIMSLSSLMKKFNEQNSIIDILKIDIEFSEWDSFTSILQDGLFANVKQLLFETHTEEVQGRTTSLTSYIRFLKIWNELYKLGFRQWKHHWNHFGNFNSPSGTQRTCCYEHYLINTHFL